MGFIVTQIQVLILDLTTESKWPNYLAFLSLKYDQFIRIFIFL